MPDPVLILDGGARLVAANRAAEEMFGDLSIADGRSFGDAFDVRQVSGSRALDESLPEVGTEIEYSFTSAGGVAGRMRVTVQRAPDGMAVVAARAVGEESGMAVVSTVSHELRSPLTSVKGYVSLMLNRWDRIDDAKKREMLEQVHHDADRVTRLVTELLDISRLETGRLVLKRQLVDLEALTVAVVEKVNISYPALDCTVDLPGLPEVYADSDKIEQVVTNLVENAAKYGEPAGMKVTGAVDSEMVMVSVTDRGEGIPTDDVEKVFSKFFRRDYGKPTGTGLGLWISRGLVEAHGGTLTVESVVGEGCTFSFTLPTAVPDMP